MRRILRLPLDPNIASFSAKRHARSDKQNNAGDLTAHEGSQCGAPGEAAGAAAA
jgi:hypothetical protein